MRVRVRVSVSVSVRVRVRVRWNIVNRTLSIGGGTKLTWGFIIPIGMCP